MKNYITLLESSDEKKIGAKALNLKKIGVQQDYSIPQTIVLNSELYYELLRFNKIKNPLTFDWKKLQIPQNIIDNIFEIIDATFGDKPLVVRSSASCEDSPLFSFAGQYSSFLNIKGRSKITKAIKLCYASLFSENALFYSNYNNINLKNQYMAILIQEVKKISLSGIMFTADPVTENKKSFIIEYAKGLGDKIVGGNIKPAQYRISINKIPKNIPNIVKKLVIAGKKIQEKFGRPQDIEWGILNNQILIFQSRPINFMKENQHQENFNGTKEILLSGETICPGKCKGSIAHICKESDLNKITDKSIVIIDCAPTMKIIEKIPKICGMIIRGGILSHFAVIAREFNIPTIVYNKKIKFIYTKTEAYLDSKKGILYLI